MTNGDIIPSRISMAREARAMSMEELANYVGVTRQTISKYENGIVNPSPEVLRAVSKALDFPMEFFYKAEPVVTARSSSLFFRSRANIANKVKSACRWHISMVDEMKKQLEEYVDFVEQDLFTLDEDFEDLTFDDIEELAHAVRNRWELGDSPIGDLIGILENRGIIIAQLASSDKCPFRSIDAFSSWLDGTPYILYHSVQKSAVRTRFSISHELAHLIMHSSIVAEDASKKAISDFADAQADYFAAAFLLPPESFPDDIHGSSLDALIRVKQKWGVALSTIIRRCKTLHLLTENQISYLERQMTAKKYWHREPLDDILSIEQPEMLQDAVRLLTDNKIRTKVSLLNASGLSPKEFTCICSLPDDYFDEYVRSKKPILRVVK